VVDEVAWKLEMSRRNVEPKLSVNQDSPGLRDLSLGRSRALADRRQIALLPPGQ
jgi:hypothetical protein